MSHLWSFRIFLRYIHVIMLLIFEVTHPLAAKVTEESFYVEMIASLVPIPYKIPLNCKQQLQGLFTKEMEFQ